MTVMEYELGYGEEIRGVTCPQCGGTLVNTKDGAYCDYCDAYVPVVPVELVEDAAELDEAFGTYADFADGYWGEDE